MNPDHENYSKTTKNLEKRKASLVLYNKKL
jgi:hypothetical protein